MKTNLRQCSIYGNHSRIDCLQSYGLQHPRLPWSSLFPWVCSNSCPLSRWCYLTIFSSVVPFSLCPRSFPSPGSFPVSPFLASGGQSTGASASASVLPVSIQSWFHLGLTSLISLQSRELSKSLLQHHSLKASVLQLSSFFIVSHPYMTAGKTIALTIGTFVGKVIASAF